ncbi:MAG: hypothetical protein IT279_14445 [Ignavibacteriaceae bacterium]|nr:hypothetical protein [Ignavibacteriaceae bacterium]
MSTFQSFAITHNTDTSNLQITLLRSQHYILRNYIPLQETYGIDQTG